MSYRTVPLSSIGDNVESKEQTRSGRSALVVHGEDDAEFCFPAHHSGVAFVSSYQRVLFNHGPHARHFLEAERVLGVGRDSAGPPLDAPFVEKQLKGRYWLRANRQRAGCPCSATSLVSECLDWLFFLPAGTLEGPLGPQSSPLRERPAIS